MLTKGIVIAEIENRKKYSVRLPIFETPDSKNYVVDCTICANAGTVSPYQPGDVVWVAFENNDIGYPVIVGRLYLGPEKEKANAGQKLSSLMVEGTASLPINTTIGGVSFDRLVEYFRKANNLDDRLLNTEGELNPFYSRFEKVRDYLWYIDYNYIDEELANKWAWEHMIDESELKAPKLKYKKANKIRPSTKHRGACSATRIGNLYARNYDWFFAKTAEFIIHVPAIGTHYESIGIGSISFTPEEENGVEEYLKLFNDNKIKENMNRPDYKVLPFMMSDAINSKGLVVNINVAPDLTLDEADLIPSKISKAQVEEKHTVVGPLLVRFIVDRFEKAKEAAEYVRDYVTYIAPNAGMASHEYHFMVADPTGDTYLIEFLKGKTVIHKYNVTEAPEGTVPLDIKPIMTNFYMGIGHNGGPVNYNADKSLTIQHDDSREPICNVTLFGQGVERYNRINARYDSIAAMSDDNKLAALKKLFNTNDINDEDETIRYSIMYRPESRPTSKVDWKSEFVGYTSFPEGYKPMMITSKLTEGTMEGDEYFDQWYRRITTFYDSEQGAGVRPDPANQSTWHTVHTSIYDISKKRLYLKVQEGEQGTEVPSGEYIEKWYEINLDNCKKRLESFVGSIVSGDEHIDNEYKLKELYGWDTTWELVSHTGSTYTWRRTK